jgi:hypothetical protein
MATEHEIKRKYEALCPLMNERMRRWWAAIEADALGKGGIAIVERATGMSRTTIRAGRDEFRAGIQNVEVVRVRRPGGGRPRLEERHPDLLAELESLMEPVTHGDYESPLRWTSRGVRQLAAELTDRGKRISAQKVGQLLNALGYRVNGMPKALEGGEHPDRKEQFEFIKARVEAYHARNAPVISVDMRRKEFFGGSQDAVDGRQLEGQQGSVLVHDLIDPDPGKMLSNGIHDMGHNKSRNGVGVDPGTVELAALSISRWWSQMGRKVYEKATELLIIIDGAGSHSGRSQVFKLELQKFADHIGLTIGVSCLPPGTSKWNKIEHRMACQVTEGWGDRMPVHHEIVVQLVGITRTTRELCVKAKLDRPGPISNKVCVSDPELQEINLIEDEFYGGWNYTVAPRRGST